MHPAADDSTTSVVLQGPVVHEVDPLTRQPVTAACIANVKRLLPKAEIVLSTWPGEKTAGLPCDVVVENQDPGKNEHPNWFDNFRNTNRMLVSVKAGVSRASREHVLRFRTDQVLESTGFLEAFNAPQRPRSAKPWFRERLVISNVYTGHPYRCGRPVIFHYSDMATFGLREDLRRLWDVPLISPEATPAGMHPLLGVPGRRLVPEQYIAMHNFLKSQPDFDPASLADHAAMARESEQFLLDNYVVLAMEDYAFRWPNRRRHLLSRYGAYTAGDLRRLLTRGTSKGFPPPADAVLPTVVYFFDSRMRSKTPGIYRSVKGAYHRVFGHR